MRVTERRFDVRFNALLCGLISVRMCTYMNIRTHEYFMRTNIVIDDKLMEDALKITGSKTKKEAVEMGLRTLIKLNEQKKIKRFRGKLKWEGNLENMRNDS